MERTGELNRSKRRILTLRVVIFIRLINCTIKHSSQHSQITRATTPRNTHLCAPSVTLVFILPAPPSVTNPTCNSPRCSVFSDHGLPKALPMVFPNPHSRGQALAQWLYRHCGRCSWLAQAQLGCQYYVYMCVRHDFGGYPSNGSVIIMKAKHARY